MAPKMSRLRADLDLMTLTFRTKRRSTSTCAHESQVTTELSGLSRSVCESCGRVSVAYVENHYSPDRVREIETRLTSGG